MYMNIDGVLHKLLGTRGSWGWELDARKIPWLVFKYVCLFQPVADAALPAADYSGFVTPIAVNKANTPTFTVDGYAAVMQSWHGSVNNDVKYRNLVNYEGVDNVDRSPSGSVDFEMTSVATKDWIAMARNKTKFPIDCVHGIVAGNIIQIQTPYATLGKPKYGEKDGILMIKGELDYMPNGTAGNNELSLTAR